MTLSVAINPTYCYVVEKALYDGGDLDLSVEFTKSHPSSPLHITEVTVKAGSPPDIQQKVKLALRPFMS